MPWLEKHWTAPRVQRCNWKKKTCILQEFVFLITSRLSPEIMPHEISSMCIIKTKIIFFMCFLKCSNFDKNNWVFKNALFFFFTLAFGNPSQPSAQWWWINTESLKTDHVTAVVFNYCQLLRHLWKVTQDVQGLKGNDVRWTKQRCCLLSWWQKKDIFLMYVWLQKQWLVGSRDRDYSIWQLIAPRLMYLNVSLIP